MKRYCFAYVIFLTFFCFPLWGNSLYLSYSGEFAPLKDIVRMQRNREQFCIYGTGVRDVRFHYKQEGFAQTRPKILVLGSSRVLQFREKFFKETFFNAGSAMDRLEDGKEPYKNNLNNI